MILKPYWINIDHPMSPLGIGITAYSTADAEQLLAHVLSAPHQITRIEQISDFQSLDQNHVVPNMGNWLRRGIWFPNGFGHQQG